MGPPGPFDLPPPEGAAVPDATRGVFADREPAEPPRPPPAAPAGPQAADYLEDWQSLEEAAPCEFEEQDMWASLIPPPPAGAFGSRTIRRGHFPRRDPRHTGPRPLHAGGGVEICRQFNRGRCGGQACAHNRAHVCSQCGVAGHAATGCTTPESVWLAKE